MLYCCCNGRPMLLQKFYLIIFSQIQLLGIGRVKYYPIKKALYVLLYTTDAYRNYFRFDLTQRKRNEFLHTRSICPAIRWSLQFTIGMRLRTPTST